MGAEDRQLRSLGPSRHFNPAPHGEASHLAMKVYETLYCACSTRNHGETLESSSWPQLYTKIR